MNTRQRMRLSNEEARKWLLTNGYDDVWIKPHYKFNSITYTRDGKNYPTQDIYNLHDGICKGDREYVYIQISTNKLHEKQKYIEESEKFNITVMLLAPVTKDKDSREYTGIKIFLVRNGKVLDETHYEY